MGSADRIIRVIIAAIVGILYFTGTISGTLGIVSLVLAGVFVLTSVINFCPLYGPLESKLVKSKKNKRQHTTECISNSGLSAYLNRFCV